MTVIHVLPKRFEDFLRHLDCNSPRHQEAMSNTLNEFPNV